MQIILTENEIKNAIIMFLQSKMSLDDTVDVELSTQGRGGQTIIATVDLDSSKNTSNSSNTEPKKEENTDTLPEEVKPQEEENNVNSEALFSEEEPKKEEENASVEEDSPFGRFA